MLGTTNLRMCKKEHENPNEPIYKFIESYSSKSAKNSQIKPINRIHQVVLDHIKESEQFMNIIVKEKENIGKRNSFYLKLARAHYVVTDCAAEM